MADNTEQTDQETQDQSQLDPKSKVDLTQIFREMVETVRPDLRKSMRPSLVGTVTAVHDTTNEAEAKPGVEEEDDYYTVDVIVGDEDGVPGMELPEIPVASIWAQDGYGVFALPEVGAQVTVTCHSWDQTQPYVEAPQFRNGMKPPAGFKAGTFAIRGKHRQKIAFSPTHNEIVISSASLKMITTQKKQEHVSGDNITVIEGNHDLDVKGENILHAKELSVVIDRSVEAQYGSLKETVTGGLEQNIGGALKQNIGGVLTQAALGGIAVSTPFSKREIVGGGYEMLVAATPGIAPLPIPKPPLPPTAAYNILVANAGGLTLNTIGGIINLGSLTSGPVQLGGITALAQGAVHGPSLVAFFTSLLGLLQTSLQLNYLGIPTIPNPTFSTAIGILMTSVLTPAPPTGTGITSIKVFCSSI